jgi:CRP-like cAMP-binding protein
VNSSGVPPDHAGGTTSSAGKKTAEVAIGNLILASLDPAEREGLWPFLELFPLSWHTVLHEPGEPIEFAYFPNSGVVSLVVSVKDGKSVEVSLVGKEGFFGAPLAGGFDKSPHRSLVQVPGDAYRMRASVLRDLLPAATTLRILMTRYALIQSMQLAQTAACNRLHALNQRLARWLLMIHDRVDTQALNMTHERLASLLGTDRPSVSDVAGGFQKSGMIAYKRGTLTILSRRKLKEAACECYDIMQEYYSHLGIE